MQPLRRTCACTSGCRQTLEFCFFVGVLASDVVQLSADFCLWDAEMTGNGGQSLLTSYAVLVLLRPDVPQTGGWSVLFDEVIALSRSPNLLASTHANVVKTRALLKLKFCCLTVTQNPFVFNLQRALITVNSFLARSITPDRGSRDFKVKVLVTSQWVAHFSVAVAPIYITCNFFSQEVATVGLKINFLIRRKSDWLLCKVATEKISCVHAP